MFTNCSPTGPYRGAGRPEACLILERLMEEGARTLGIDRIEMRRRNLVGPERMPHTTPTGATYDSGDVPKLLESCLALADWDGFAARQRQSEAAGKLRGRAVTCYIESAGVFNERMDLRFDPSGGVTILAGTHSHGQGHATVFPQLVHEWLGIPYDEIRYAQGDTDLVLIGRGTYAARSAMLASTALRAAADEAIAKGAVMAARLLDGDPAGIDFDDGLYRLADTNRTIAFTDVVRAFFAPVGVPAGLSVGLATSGSAGGEHSNYPNGVHVGEVEVDPETGHVHVDRYTVCDDVGRVLNPMICEGQIVGGIAQGIGQALLEAIVYEPGTGQLLSGSFTDYGMPRSDITPPVRAQLFEVPCLTNPLGVKGVGESGTIGAPATIVNAVLDALRPLGVRDLEMPLSAARVWSAIEAARRAPPAG